MGEEYGNIEIKPLSGGPLAYKISETFSPNCPPVTPILKYISGR